MATSRFRSVASSVRKTACYDHCYHSRLEVARKAHAWAKRHQIPARPVLVCAECGAGSPTDDENPLDEWRCAL